MYVYLWILVPLVLYAIGITFHENKLVRDFRALKEKYETDEYARACEGREYRKLLERVDTVISDFESAAFNIAMDTEDAGTRERIVSLRQEMDHQRELIKIEFKRD